MSETYQVFALKYAERNTRTRADSFLFDDDHASPHPMDYYVWVARNNSRTILVDTGYDRAEGQRRGRAVIAAPRQILREIGLRSDDIQHVIITHLHYDHAGTLYDFGKAQFHLQASEMAFATGPCMCHEALRETYTAEHVCEMVRMVYSGRVTFYDGDGEVAPGLTVHRVGGHSGGMQVVRVMTTGGPLVLASDASHFYENFEQKKLFPIVVDAEAMLKGFDRLIELAGGDPKRVVPGHDPLVRARVFRRKKFGGMEVSDAKKLRALEDENARLKKLLAEAYLDNAAMKDLLAKNW